MHFPSFNTAHEDSIFAVRGHAGFATWRGTFCGMKWKSGPPQPLGSEPGADLGLSTGPVVVYEGLENGGSNHALVVSPATHFKGATMNRWGDDWTVGMSGEITEVPAGFRHETIVVAGEGVTGTVDAFGQAMRAAHNTSKQADPAVDSVGYWTE